MTTFMPDSNAVAEAANPALDSLFKLWMLPTQVGIGLMESSLTMMMGAMPPAREATAKTSEQAQDIARAAEEQVAHLDDGHRAIPTPAGLVA